MSKNNVTIKTLCGVYLQCLDSNDVPVIINFIRPNDANLDLTNEDGTKIVKMNFEVDSITILAGLVGFDTVTPIGEFKES